MGSGTAETYGDPEEIAPSGSPLRRAGAVVSVAPLVNTGPSDLSGSTINIQQDGSGILHNMGLIGAIVQLVVDLLIALGTWIAGLLQGVPQQAKTTGTGSQLVHADDAVTQFIGFQLAGGGALGRVLSEGNWPQNYTGLVLAHGGALIEFINREPPWHAWKVRNTPPQNVTKFGYPARAFRVGPIPPPSGAPYDNPVTVAGFYAAQIRSPADYKSKFGFDWPTPQQFVRYLHDTGGVLWNDSRIRLDRLAAMQTAFLALWQQSYLTWLNKNPPPAPGPNPDPCSLPELPPCPPTANTQGDQLTDFIQAEGTYLYYIARSLERMAAASASPQDAVCCANVVQAINAVSTQISQVFNAIKDAEQPPLDLTGLVAALGQLVAAAQSWPALWDSIANLIGGKLDHLASAVSNVASSSSTQGIVDQLKQWNAINDVPPVVLSQIVQDKAVPAQYAKFMQGTAAETVAAILAAATLISSPTDMAKLLSGDSSDLTGRSKAGFDEITRAAPAFFAAMKPIVNADSKTFTETLAKLFTKYLTANDVVVEPVVKGLVDSIKAMLSPAAGAVPTPAGLPVNADAPIAAATGVALSAAIAAWIGSGFGVEGGESLVKLAEIIGGAIGYEELRDVQIGPLIRNGIAANAELQAKFKMRQYMPGIGAIVSWFARGLMSDSDASAGLRFNAVSEGLIPIEKAAGFHGMQARQIIRLIETGIFTNDDLTNELTFSGMRLDSQHRTLLAAPYIATQSQRGQLRAAIEAAYEAGLYTDTDLTTQLDSAEHNTDRNSLVLTAMRLRKRTIIANQLAGSFATLHEAGITDINVFRSQLTGIGLQPDKVNALAQVADAKLTATLKRQADAAERTLVRETIHAERQAAIENFKHGSINAAALAAALVLTGLTAAQAASWVDLVVLQKDGAQRWIYGLQKTPEQAELLSERVTALLDQRRRELIEGAAFVKGLQGLGIPVTHQNALIARANATITPKKDAFVTPVTTSG